VTASGGAEARLPRILTIMGSGETTPTMVRAHRAVIDRLGPRPVPAVLLDTPYGFQENAEDISARAVEYFRNSVGNPMTVATMRSAEVDPLVRETALARIREARLAFAGPGSPSYALRQWSGTDVPRLLASKLAEGGAVTMASAAALTLGRFTIPVYEIYKVGEEPRWLQGLDLLTPLGLPVAVVPHYDNAEGGNHDTRFCYLGERRLRVLEADLPPDVFILGVDGHTALTIELDSGRCTVTGLGKVTIRKDGHSTVFPTGTEVGVADLVAAAGGKLAGEVAAGLREREPVAAGSRAAAAASGAPTHAPAPQPRPLREEVAALEAVFSASLDECDAQAAVRAILTLEETIQAWAGDTDQSDALANARAALRNSIVCLGEMAATGSRDPRELIGPFVDALLAERRRARDAQDWAAADVIRDRLLVAGIELHDTPDGTTWELREGEPVG
jgi:cyanophycinase-like exopeptidase